MLITNVAQSHASRNLEPVKKNDVSQGLSTLTGGRATLPVRALAQAPEGSLKSIRRRVSFRVLMRQHPSIFA